MSSRGFREHFLKALRVLVVALAVLTDDLVFDPTNAAPRTSPLRLHLAALDQLEPDERADVRVLIEGALLRQQAHRLARTS